MPARVTFGRFELDLESGALTREGTRVRLQPQPGRVLAILVEQAGEVVPRETLRQQVWPDGTFVDFERGLNFCIAQVRAALGDSADSPRFVETLPRRGYRFIAPVTRLDQAPAPIAAAALTAPAAHPHRPRVWLPLVGLFAFAIVTAALVLAAWRAAAVDGATRVAVVPFDNETGMDEYDVVARAVADATVARLAAPSRIGMVSVIGNAAALFQPRAFRDLKRIGLELNADYIVLAQMKRDTGKVRLIAHLIRISDESHLWARTFDAPEFTLDEQSRIAEAIAAAVTEVLASPPSPRPRSARPRAS
jgi:DNA-binding winged helix-turn-helix (wHTH) protein/TolB-like protein